MSKPSPEAAFQRALEGTEEPDMEELVRLAKALEHMRTPIKKSRHLKTASLRRLNRSARDSIGLD